MDYGTFRGVITVIILVVFIGIVVWAYSKRRKSAFDEAANMIFDDKDAQQEKDNKQES
ncbi:MULTISPECIES: cbb3-type cytochrome oxidase subunit 3 [Corallincola]|uniref:Cbb3-type cytochrome c oxidase subunit 3 n=3 Tax=Corallincola TaxID=1775176 RepID=A0A368NRE8_9GAMM|nr:MULTISPECIES: cbb3-type cytochrome c oxidase subunit 3 [Corallincola]RCU52680.1 cbb3-type cytochrome c oxidase subunit 3 [Corallincola holothuriorum]TAA48140.1 cbb3-type cytochrome c oxidase subunit 3 [Corallincola spongiicola]TCI03180.1 cbb3-type cytochrome c oxidase subunit 3 [Corallincola luteus]